MIVPVAPVTNPRRYKAAKPVHWLIAVCDDSGKVFHSRMPFNKHDTCQEAYHDAYGSRSFSDNVLFFDLSPRITEARKLLREIHRTLEKTKWF